MSLVGTVISLMPLLGVRVGGVVVAPRAVGHRDRQRRVRVPAAGVLELGGDVVAAQMAQRPSRTAAPRAACCVRVRVCALPRSSCPPSSPSPGAGSRPSCSGRSMACDEVRELRGERVHPAVDLGRVHVLRDEVLLEVRRRAAAGPCRPTRSTLLVSLLPVASARRATGSTMSSASPGRRRRRAGATSAAVVHVAVAGGVAVDDLVAADPRIAAVRADRCCCSCWPSCGTRRRRRRTTATSPGRRCRSCVACCAPRRRGSGPRSS